MKIYPFGDGDTFATFRNIIEKVTKEVILGTSIGILVNNLIVIKL